MKARLMMSALAVLCGPLLSENSAAQTVDPISVADSLSRMVYRGAITSDLETLQNARRLARRALTAYPGHVLLKHHLAETYFREATAVIGEDRGRGLQLLEQSQDVLEAALEREEMAPAETHALLGSVIGMQITNPFRGMTMGPRANRAIERAMELDPTSPRVWLAKGISLLHTPGLFGGGTERAVEALERGTSLLADDSPGPGHPRGGAAELWAWIGVAQMRSDRLGEAREAFQRALDLQPEFAWVRDVLLPATESSASE